MVDSDATVRCGGDALSSLKIVEGKLRDLHATMSLAERKDHPAWAVKRSRMLLSIMSYLCTGWLPWGVDWRRQGAGIPCLSEDDPGRGRYTLCCGHVVTPRLSAQLIETGLLADIPGADAMRALNGGRRVLVITESGRAWLKLRWDR